MDKQIKIRPKDKQLWEDFDDYLEAKYGTNYSVKSPEIERGLYFLLQHENWTGYENGSEEYNRRDTQGNSTHKKLAPRKIRFLKAYDSSFKDVELIKFTTLDDFIAINLNIKDNRAIKGWVDFLKRNGWIEEIPRTRTFKNKFPHLTWKGDMLGESYI